jgi:hypothetical protein
MSKKIDKIAAKKLELEQNLARLQQGLEQNISEVKGDVTQTVNPTEVVRRHPLPVVGAAIAVGFLIGISGSKKNRTSRSPKSSLAEGIGSSIKKRLSQKAVDLAMDYLENRISQKKVNSRVEE